MIITSYIVRSGHDFLCLGESKFFYDRICFRQPSHFAKEEDARGAAETLDREFEIEKIEIYI